MIATEHTRSRLFAWARGVAIATLVANVALYVGLFALAPSPTEVAASPNAFGANTGWAFLLVPLTGLLFVVAVVLSMEYRVRSRDAADPHLKKRLRDLALLLAPTAVHVAVLVGLVGFALIR